MTNYYKVYLKHREKAWKRADVKTSKEVKDILQEAQRRGYERYLVIKRIKQKTDQSIAHGFFSKECKVVEVDGLDTDWRIVGANVVDWGKYKKAKEGEER